MWPKSRPRRPAGFCGKQQAGEESRTEGGDKTKIHELIVGETYPDKWGEPELDSAKVFEGMESSHVYMLNSAKTLRHGVAITRSLSH